MAGKGAVLQKPRQQGKAWDQSEVIEILKPFFKLGYNVKKACECAGLATSTVETWIRKDQELRAKITAWKNEPNVASRRVTVEVIKERDKKGRPTNRSVENSKWWSERREKQDFSTKSEHGFTNDEGRDVTGVFLEALKKGYGKSNAE